MRCFFRVPSRLLLLTLLTGACGSESNDLSSITPQPTPTETPNVNTDATSGNDNLLNPNLSGSLYYYDRARDGSIIFDIKTGVETVAKDTNWRERFNGEPTFVRSVPLEDQRGEVAVTFGPCTASGLTDCVVIHQDDGAISEYNLLGNSPVGGARLSRDGQYYATLERNSDFDLFLKVYTRKGEKVSSKLMSLDISDFRWLPSGRIVYRDVVPGRLIFTAPFTATPDKQWDLPDTHSGVLSNFDVSPDGNEIAFLLRGPHEGLNNYYPDLYVLDIPTQAIRRIATAHDKRLEVNEPKSPGWSFDGQWIFVKDGGYQPGLSSVEPPGTIFAVPAHMNKVLTISRIDSERSPEILKIYRRGITGNLPESIWPRGEYFWRP